MKLRLTYRSSEKRKAEKLLCNIKRFLEKKGYNVKVSKKYRGRRDRDTYRVYIDIM